MKSCFSGCLFMVFAGVSASEPAVKVAVPEQIILYSIDGNDYAPGEGPKAGGEKFGRYPVLGKVEIKDAGKREEIFAVLEKGIRDSDGRIAKCFLPRHVVRAVSKGKTVDYIVCFQCLQVQVVADGKSKTLPITAEPLAVFNRHLKAAGIPLAPGGAKER
jgi:hypothetical protein